MKYFKSLVTGNDRTSIVKKNIIGSFGVKGLSIGISLLLIPLTVKLLDQEKYGIWMTVFSIVTWFNMMDIGIGNGFRNKFAQAIARNDKQLAREYVQTLYSSILIIAILFFLFFLSINPFLDWYKILNIFQPFDENISLILIVVFALFCFQLYTKNITTILLALQKTTESNLVILYGNVLSLVFILVLQVSQLATLFTIATAFMLAPVVVFIVYSFLLFKVSLREFKPKLFVLPQKKYLNDLISIGLKFFFIQLTTIVMFSSSNIIICQLFGPERVTPYNITFRLFSSLQTVFTIIVTPFWSAFTHANESGDYKWIKLSINKLIKIWAIFCLIVLVFWLFSPYILNFWLGKDFGITYYLSLQFAFFVIITTWSNLFVFYINGVGKIKLQLIIAFFQCIVNIPLSIFLAKNVGLNATGIILATNINMLLPAIFIPIQYFKLINKKATGIWAA